MKTFVSKNLYALILLLIAAILRLSNLGNIDFVHDELSALSRTGYWSFSELIAKGVLTDTHPLLTQVLLNYWVLLTGTHEITVKLPFIFAGLAGLWLLWLIGKSWFSETAALTAMAYLACSEYVIYFHQQARPYALGFFLCLMLVWAFGKWSRHEGKIPYRYLGLYILSAVLAAMTHHLAMLFVMLFGFASVLLVRKEQLKIWFLANACIVLLYLPAIGVTLQQLGQKGIGGWLAPPDGRTFHYIGRWFTHYATITTLVMGIPAVAGMALGWKLARRKLVLLIVAGGGITIPFLYSIYVNPIFQYSTLFFVLPLLLLFFYSGLPDRKYSALIPLMVLLVTGGTFLLKRNYYAIMSRQPVAEMCRQSIHFLKGHPGANTLSCLNTEAWFVQFYQRKYGFEFPFVTWYDQKFKANELTGLIEKKRPEYLLLAWMPQVAIPVGKSYLPCMRIHKRSPQLDFYAFGKPDGGVCVEEAAQFESKLFDDTKTRFWEENVGRIVTNDSTRFMEFKSGDEFGLAFEAPMADMHINRHSILECSASFIGPVPEKVYLTAVINMEGKEKPMLYIAEAASDQNSDYSKGRSLYLRSRIVDVFRENRQLALCSLKVYIWNAGKQPLKVSQVQVKWLEGNDEMYSLYEE